MTPINIDHLINKQPVASAGPTITVQLAPGELQSVTLFQGPTFSQSVMVRNLTKETVTVHVPAWNPFGIKAFTHAGQELAVSQGGTGFVILDKEAADPASSSKPSNLNRISQKA